MQYIVVITITIILVFVVVIAISKLAMAAAAALVCALPAILILWVVLAGLAGMFRALFK